MPHRKFSAIYADIPLIFITLENTLFKLFHYIRLDVLSISWTLLSYDVSESLLK